MDGMGCFSIAMGSCFTGPDACSGWILQPIHGAERRGLSGNFGFRMSSSEIVFCFFAPRAVKPESALSKIQFSNSNPRYKGKNRTFCLLFRKLIAKSTGFCNKFA
jgi:hypothetical protein